MSEDKKFEDGLTFIFIVIGIILFILFFFFVLSPALEPTPDEIKIYKECKKLQNLKEVYNNLSLFQKDYIYYNCL